MFTLLAIALGVLVALSSASGAATLAASTTTTVVTGTVLTCPAENVVLTGVETVLAIDTGTASGHRTTQFVFNLRGVRATGQTSGTTYSVNGVSVVGSTFAIGGANSASTSTFVQTWLLVPSGGGKPLSFHEVLTVIYNASGALVAVVSQGPADCN
jgi:hypothetical protein